MTRLPRALVFTAILLASCATTTVGSTWRAPDFAGPPLHKVLVCALHPDDADRRMLEDAFVSQLQAHGVTGVPCYGALPPGQPTEAQVREAVTTSGADGVIVTKVAGVKEIPVYGVGPAYYWGPFYGAYGPEWSAVYAPGYIQTETEVDLQTRAYSTQQNGELIWFGTSQTFDPASIKDLISQVVPKFISTMTKAGVLPAAQPPPAVGESR